uniref:Uncharacterized protein n=1 Tax=Rhodopseudomonas palustris (strain DX-1) TaxID=652103 RepID=E6VIA7_RHOPX
MAAPGAKLVILRERFRAESIQDCARKPRRSENRKQGASANGEIDSRAHRRGARHSPAPDWAPLPPVPRNRRGDLGRETGPERRAPAKGRSPERGRVRGSGQGRNSPPLESSAMTGVTLAAGARNCLCGKSNTVGAKSRRNCGEDPAQRVGRSIASTPCGGPRRGSPPAAGGTISGSRRGGICPRRSPVVCSRWTRRPSQHTRPLFALSCGTRWQGKVNTRQNVCRSELLSESCRQMPCDVRKNTDTARLAEQVVRPHPKEWMVR